MEREEQFRRNHDLFEMFMLEALNDPTLTKHIPDGAEVIFLPENDLELAEANRDHAQVKRQEGKQVVFAWVKLVPEGRTVFIPRLDEDDLVRRIRGEFYQVFQERGLKPKKEREAKAWNMLLTNRGNYTRQAIDQIFDVVDDNPYAPNRRWFGGLLIIPNRNRMFQSPSTVESINRWIDNLLFSGDVLEKRLATAEQSRPKGASNGIATLLLYLQDPQEYNIWLPTTHQSLELVGRIQGLEILNWSRNYPVFNSAAIAFRDKHGFEPQEVDWALWMIEMITQNSPAFDRYRS